MESVLGFWPNCPQAYWPDWYAEYMVREFLGIELPQ
jgi:hypothetical protein